jgi:hypothetical protein
VTTRGVTIKVSVMSDLLSPAEIPSG